VFGSGPGPSSVSRGLEDTGERMVGSALRCGREACAVACLVSGGWWLLSSLHWAASVSSGYDLIIIIIMIITTSLQIDRKGVICTALISPFLLFPSHYS
jgi:hypothetical protein